MSHRVRTADVPSAHAGESARHQMTLEALAEVDAGKTDSHEEVVRWVAKLRTAADR